MSLRKPPMAAGLGSLLAVAGLAAVLVLSVPSLQDGIRTLLRGMLLAIWVTYTLQFFYAFVRRPGEAKPRGIAAGLTDLACILVPLLALLPDFPERDQSLFCGVWVLKLFRDSPAFGLVARVLANEARNLLGVLSVFAVILFAAALIGHVLERDKQPDQFGSIPAAMWWAVTTLSTTGYGDAIPSSGPGRILAGLVMLCGIGVFALWAGILATGFSEELRRQDFVRNWQLVSGVPLFRRLGPGDLVEIVRVLRPRTVPAGAVLCRKGEPGDQMYFILEGRVSVAAVQEIELGAGQFFGEIALATGEPRTATVTAVTALSLLTLHAAEFQILMSRSPEVAEAIRSTVSERKGGSAKA